MSSLISRARSFSRLGLLVNRRKRARCVRRDDRLAERDHGLCAGKAEHAQHVRLRDRVAAKCDELIEHGLGVTQAALCAARDGLGGCGLEREALVLRDEKQMLRDRRGRDALQIEPLAAAEDRRRHLLHVGRREEKFHMRRRFLERLEQRVE